MRDNTEMSLLYSISCEEKARKGESFPQLLSEVRLQTCDLQSTLSQENLLKSAQIL